MAINKVWVLAEAGDSGPTPVTLELLTEARSVASTVEAVAWGSDTASMAAALGEFGATTDAADLGRITADAVIWPRASPDPLRTVDVKQGGRGDSDSQRAVAAIPRHGQSRIPAGR